MGYKKWKIRKIVYWLVPIIIILFPTFPSLLPDLIGFQLIFVLEVIFILLSWYKGIFKPQNNTITDIIIFYFISATVVSIILDLIKGVSVASDFFELAKPFTFLSFFWLYRFSIYKTNQIIDNTFCALKFICLVLAIYSILSFVLPGIFRNIEYFLYKRSSVPILANKAIGSFSQTYHFAFFLLLPLSFTFILLLKAPNIRHLLSFILILTSMLLTQSRSMYLCSLLCIVISYCCPVLHETAKQRITTISLLASFIILIFILVFQYYDVLYKNLTYAFEGLSSIYEGNNNSVSVRENQIHWALNNNRFFLIGSGIGKGEIMLESFYSLYFYRYGLIGLLLSLVLFLITAYKSYIIAKSHIDCLYKIIFYSVAVFYLLVPFSITSSCHMDSPKLSILFYGIMGLIFRKYHEIKVNKRISTIYDK